MTEGSPIAPPTEQASLLLHHLLNQSLSSLDFCILWQELASAHEELQEVDKLVHTFLETADLAALDQALAMVGEPKPDQLPRLEARPPAFDETWSVKTTRIRDVSRADFRCKRCGFELTFALEHPPNTEMRLPFEELTCPVCEEESVAYQG